MNIECVLMTKRGIIAIILIPVSVSTQLSKIIFVKSVDKTSANIGYTLTYTITYKNESSETIKNITITDSFSVN